MTVDQRRRSALYDRLAATLGHEEAGTMFELLPPADTHLATTADIDRLDHRISGVDQRITALEQRMDDRFTAMEHRLDDRIDGLRGELLTAFHTELGTELGKIHEHLTHMAGEMTTMAGRTPTRPAR